MAFNKRTWKGRQGTGLNKFSIDGATPVTVVNQPDSITEQGDALSAGNLNDLEQRIADGFDSASGELADAVEELESADTDLKSAINSNSNRIANLEQKAGEYSVVQYRGTNSVPTGKAKYAMVERIVGKSRAWNQLCKNGNFTSTAEWSGLASNAYVSGNVLYQTTEGSNQRQLYQNVDVVSGHKYLVSCDFYCSSTIPSDGISMYLFTTPTAREGFSYPSANTWKTMACILEAGSGGTVEMNLYIPQGQVAEGETTNYRNFILRDLTLIFGSGNEPSTVAEAVALCPSILEYDPYGYSLVDTTVEGVESRGFNLWDEEWELDGSSLVSKNYIPVPALTELYFKIPTGWLTVTEYDTDKNQIGSPYSIVNNTHTTASNCAYLKFIVSSGYGSTYNHDICINISGSLNGTYKPYVEPSTLSLSSPVTLRSAGSVAEEYDLESGEKTNPIGTQTFNGSSSTGWGYTASYGSAYRFDCSTFVGKAGGGITNNLFAGGSIGTADTEACELHGGDGHLMVQILASKLNNTATVEALMTYFSNNNLILRYELATPLAPTQLTPVIDNTIQTEGGGTIETIQTQTPVIDNYMDVGYLAL